MLFFFSLFSISFLLFLLFFIHNPQFVSITLFLSHTNNSILLNIFHWINNDFLFCLLLFFVFFWIFESICGQVVISFFIHSWNEWIFLMNIRFNKSRNEHKLFWLYRRLCCSVEIALLLFFVIHRSIQPVSFKWSRRWIEEKIEEEKKRIENRKQKTH